MLLGRPLDLQFVPSHAVREIRREIGNAVFIDSTTALFEHRLPYLSIYRNWDKCERLRRGLIDRFDEHEW
jgi:hypothetical protein